MFSAQSAAKAKRKAVFTPDGNAACIFDLLFALFGF